MRNLDRHTLASYGLLALSALLAIASSVMPDGAVDITLLVGSLGFFLGAAFVVGLLRPTQENRELPSVLSGISGVIGLLVLKYGKFPGAFGVATVCIALAVVGGFFVSRSRASRSSM